MIDEPPLLTILRDRPRPDVAILERMRGALTGHLVDALGGSGAMAATIKPIDPARAAFVGVALPCETGPGDNLAVMAALALAQPGEVIVAAADGFVGSAIMGDNVAWMARNAGVVALVTDGAVRDAAGIREIGVPLFAAAITPNSCARSGPGRVGLPVVCGGIAVAAGDVVVGDADGVVVVPCDRLGDVLDRLETVRAQERDVQARLATGARVPDSILSLLASDRVHYL